MSMRRAMCTAMGDKEWRRPAAVRHWQKETGHYANCEDYWASFAGAPGKSGPMALMRHTLERAGIGCSHWNHWEFDGRAITPRRTPMHPW